MTTPSAPPRLRLRDLPLAARLVLTVFLISVGLGYFSAMVQLHMQHSGRNGEPMPTVADVVEKFAGLKAFDGVTPRSKIESVVSGPKDGAFDKNNMTPAFFAKSGSGYDKECQERGKAVVDAERDGERLALIAWCNSSPPGEQGGAREKAYVDDLFQLPEALNGKPISEDFFDKEKKTVAIKSLIDARCGKCHSGDKKPDLDEFPKIAPLATAPPLEVIPDVLSADKQWQRSTRQLTVEGLTQSTHAHMLSFSVLFTLTGLVFAFSSYPEIVRGVIGPVVLVAQIADISCWWLARMPGYGPYFAMAIIGTGAVVGLGLATQIVFGLFDLYRWKGKAVLVLVFLLGLGVVGTVWTKAIAPGLEQQRNSAAGKLVEEVGKAMKDNGK